MTITNERLSELESYAQRWPAMVYLYAGNQVALNTNELLELCRAYRAAQPTPRDGGETIRCIVRDAIESDGTYRERLDVAVAKLLALLPACPEGFVLVPKEPTEAMRAAFGQALGRRPHERSWELSEEIYRAMLAAAPQPHEGKV